jgi:hypothetical protein
MENTMFLAAKITFDLPKDAISLESVISFSEKIRSDFPDHDHKIDLKKGIVVSIPKANHGPKLSFKKKPLVTAPKADPSGYEFEAVNA